MTNTNLANDIVFVDHTKSTADQVTQASTSVPTSLSNITANSVFVMGRCNVLRAEDAAREFGITYAPRS